MKDYWFKRSMGFGYIPIKTQGTIVLSIMMILFFGGGLMWLEHRDNDSIVGDVGYFVALASVIVGNVVIFNKLR